MNRELLHATALGFCSLAPWLHESRQTIEIVCCNVCHFAWSHRIAFSPACWRLSIIAYCKCCILTNLSIAAAFWSVFQSNTYPIYIFIYTIYSYCWLCCLCMWWCQSAALSLWAVCESSRTVSAGFSIDRACITVLKFDLFLKRWVRSWAVCSSFAVLLLHSLDFFSLVYIWYYFHFTCTMQTLWPIKLLRSWHFSRAEVDDPVSRGIPSTLDLEIQWFAGGLAQSLARPQSENQAWDWDLGPCLRILWKGQLWVLNCRQVQFECFQCFDFV